MKNFKFNRLKVTLTLLVLLALSGLLESSAYSYIQNISEKNLGFLGLVAEIQFVLAGMSDFVPFLKGHSDSLNSSFGKVENYLLIVNGLSLIELMLLGISKNWLFKIFAMIILLGVLLRKSSSLNTKLLILVLTINPGLPLFSVAMNHLSVSASIDYGDKYYTELQNSVSQLKEEKAQLSQQHEKNLTQISNGDKKGLVFFKKLKEDISYDVTKAKTTIKGDFTHLRLLIHDGGKELVRKIVIFCSMVIFSLLLMPVGYSLVVYTIYKSVITSDFRKEVEVAESKVESKFHSQESHIKNLFRGVSSFFVFILKKMSLAKTQASIQLKKEEKVESEIAEDIQAGETKIRDHLEKESSYVISKAEEKVDHVQSFGEEVKEIEDYHAKNIQNSLVDVPAEIKLDEGRIENESVQDKTRAAEAIAHEENELKQKVEATKNKVTGFGEVDEEITSETQVVEKKVKEVIKDVDERNPPALSI